MKKLLLIPIFILILTGCNKPAETQNIQQPETPQDVISEEQSEETSEEVATENTDILYNEDGSIDTSNWKNAEIYGDNYTKFYPSDWFFYKSQRPFPAFISNMFYENLSGGDQKIHNNLDENEVRISFNGMPYDAGTDEYDIDSIFPDAINHVLISNAQQGLDCGAFSDYQEYSVTQCEKISDGVYEKRKFLILKNREFARVEIMDITMESKNLFSVESNLIFEKMTEKFVQAKMK